MNRPHGKRLPALASVDGQEINIATLEDAVALAADAAESARSFTIFTLNLDHLVKLRRDEAFRAAYEQADFITADGAPVAALARRQGVPVQRATGADLVAPLCQEAAGRGLPVYFFGSRDMVLKAACDELSLRCGGRLKVAGMASPPHGFDPEGAEADAAIEHIAASRARLCFIALGAPKQELFAARARAKGVKCGFVCIGAALDFIAGEQVRAPRIMQAMNLEWLWRLATNPRRLAARYGECAWLLADIVAVRPFRDMTGGNK